MNIDIKKEKLLENFQKETIVINLFSEYGRDYTGSERYGIITDLTDEELLLRYSEILDKYKPYIILKTSYEKERRKYIKNEKKYMMRSLRNYGISLNFDFVDSYPDLWIQDISEEYIKEELSSEIGKALDSLTDIQKKIIVQYIFFGKSKLAIAKELGKDEKTVRESYLAGLKNLRKYIKES